MHASTQPTRWRLLKSPHIRAKLAHPPLARMHAQKLICVRVARCLRQLWLISPAATRQALKAQAAACDVKEREPGSLDPDAMEPCALRTRSPLIIRVSFGNLC